MKLYYSKGACSLAVHIILEELNIPCEYEAVNLKTKITATGKNYLEINPKGAVPALELDDGQIITENTVIQQFLADKVKAFHLLPAVNELKRYRVLEWLNYVSTELHKGCSPFFNPAIPDEIKNSVFKPMMMKKLEFLELHFSANAFFMGNEFTLPDAYCFVVLAWMQPLHIDFSHLNHLTRFYNTVRARDSVKKAVSEEVSV